jgi:putative peptidoglycan lipid II flippase
MKIALICLGANLIFRAVLIFPLMHGGLALATSLSSTLNLILLLRKLGPKLGGVDIRKNIQSLLRIFLCSLPMGLAAYLTCSIGHWSWVTSGKILILSNCDWQDYLACLLGRMRNASC